MWGALALFLAGAPAQAATPLRTIVEDVPGSTAYRYGTKDSLGNSMDTLKIVSAPYGGYRGVYHTYVNGRYIVKYATSLDLVNWKYKADLALNASHATIYNLPGGAALVAYERQTGCVGGGNCMTIRYYETEWALKHAAASRLVTLQRTLSNCAEGTPSITSATSTLSNIQVSFHSLKDGKTDRQARGTPRARPGGVVIEHGAEPGRRHHRRRGGGQRQDR